MADFKKALNYTFPVEGGYVDDPDDSGGATNYGITLKTAEAYGILTKEALKNIPMNLVEKIYRDKYWKYDKLASQSVATKLFDMGVHMGLATAVKKVQSAINMFIGGGLGEDGIYGPKTEAAINALDSTIMLGILASTTFAHYTKACVGNAKNIKYLKGGWWTRAAARPPE